MAAARCFPSGREGRFDSAGEIETAGGCGFLLPPTGAIRLAPAGVALNGLMELFAPAAGCFSINFRSPARWPSNQVSSAGLTDGRWGRAHTSRLDQKEVCPARLGSRRPPEVGQQASDAQATCCFRAPSWASFRFVSFVAIETLAGS